MNSQPPKNLEAAERQSENSIEFFKIVFDAMDRLEITPREAVAHLEEAKHYLLAYLFGPVQR